MVFGIMGKPHRVRAKRHHRIAPGIIRPIDRNSRPLFAQQPSDHRLIGNAGKECHWFGRHG
jgi:hypothetical protein